MQDANALVDLVGLLRPFALFFGVVSIALMMLQGSSYLAMRTAGPVYQRSRQVMMHVAWILILLFIIGGVWIANIPGYHWASMANALNNPLSNVVTLSKGGWLHNYNVYPLLYLIPLIGCISALAVIYFARKERMLAAFVASSSALTSIIGTMGIALFPFIMPSNTHPEQSLLVWNASSSIRSLLGIEIVAVLMVPIILYYTLFVYKKLWGRGEKMSVERIVKDSKLLY